MDPSCIIHDRLTRRLWPAEGYEKPEAALVIEDRKSERIMVWILTMDTCLFNLSEKHRFQRQKMAGGFISSAIKQSSI